MKKYLIIILCILITAAGFFLNKPESGRNYKVQEQNLAQKFNAEQKTYTGENYTVRYCEIFRNKEKAGSAALLLVIHSGKERGGDNFKQLSFPAVKSLLNYAELHKEKVYILMPQYGEPYKQNYPEYINETIFELMMKKVKELNIDENKIYVTGSSRGGRAAVEIMRRHPDIFSKALLVSSSIFSCMKYLKKSEFYAVIGENDKLEEKLQKLKEIQSQSDVKIQYKILKGKNHLEAIPEGYTDEVWDWMFKTK